MERKVVIFHEIVDLKEEIKNLERDLSIACGNSMIFQQHFSDTVSAASFKDSLKRRLKFDKEDGLEEGKMGVDWGGRWG